MVSPGTVGLSTSALKQSFKEAVKEEQAKNPPKTNTNTGAATVGTSTKTSSKPTAVYENKSGKDFRKITLPEAHTLDVLNANYNPVLAKGFNEQRPEILAVFDFEPLYEGNTNVLSPVGELLDVQADISKIKTDNILSLLAILRGNEATKVIIDKLESRYNIEINKTKEIVDFARGTVSTINQLRKSFDIKGSAAAIKTEMAAIFQGSLTNIKGPREILTEYLGFSDEAYSYALNTKVLEQILSDYVVITKEYSPLLFAITSEERSKDRSSIDIKELRDAAGGKVLLKISDLNVSTFGKSNFVSYQQNVSQKLPSNFIDRVLLLTTFLSKEMSVSAGLSSTAVLNVLQNKFNNRAAGSSVFNLALGGVGDTVTDPVFGENSLASLLRVTTNDNNVVLPFETKFLSTGVDKSYIPGVQYYAESILRGRQILNLQPVGTYSAKLEDSVNTLKIILENTLLINLTGQTNVRFGGDTNIRFNLKPENLFDKLLSSVLSLFGTNSFLDRGSSTWNRLAVMMAVYKESLTNVGIRNALFRMVLYRGFEKNSAFFEEMQSSGFDWSQLLQVPHALPYRNPNVSNPYDAAVASPYDATAAAPFSTVNTNAAAQGLDILNPAVAQTGGTPSAFLQQATLVTTPLAAGAPDSLRAIFAAADQIMGILDNKYNRSSLYPSGEPENENTALLSTPGQVADSQIQNSISNHIVDFIDLIDASARDIILVNNLYDNSTQSYFNSSTPGRTKFNSISSIYIAWMVFDLYLAILTELFSFSFERNSVTAGGIKVRFNISDIENTILAIQSAIGSNSVLDPTVQTPKTNQVASKPADKTNGIFDAVVQSTSSTDRRNKLDAIRSKLRNESDVVKNILGFFMAVSKNLNKTVATASEFFSATGVNKDIIQDFRSAPDGKERFAALNDMQVAISTAMLEEFSFGRIRQDSPFIDDSFVNESQKNSIFSTFREPKFRDDEGYNLKIISVGLPSGMLDSLEARLDKFIIGQDYTSFQDEAVKEKDVIKINVYMQDLQFDDVVFKPQSFIFELSRFILNSSFKPNEVFTTSFPAILETISSKNINISTAQVVDEKISKVLNNPLYSFLSETEKRQMFENHLMSDICRMYIKILCGADLSEKLLVINENVSTTKADRENFELFQQLLSTHISGIAGRQLTLTDLKNLNPNINLLLTNIENNEVTTGLVNNLDAKIADLSKSANVQLTEDLKSFLRLFSPRSVLFSVGAQKRKIVTPKIFERIFHIIVDPDNFEIDRTKTLSTTSGKELWDKTFFADRVLTETVGTVTKYKLQPRNKRENFSEFLRFFVTIEQLPETVRIAVKPPIVNASSPASTQSKGAQQNNVPRDRTGSHASTAAGVSSSTVQDRKQQTSSNTAINTATKQMSPASSISTQQKSGMSASQLNDLKNASSSGLSDTLKSQSPPANTSNTANSTSSAASSTNSSSTASSSGIVPIPRNKNLRF